MLQIQTAARRIVVRCYHVPPEGEVPWAAAPQCCSPNGWAHFPIFTLGGQPHFFTPKIESRRQNPFESDNNNRTTTTCGSKMHKQKANIKGQKWSNELNVRAAHTLQEPSRRLSSDKPARNLTLFWVYEKPGCLYRFSPPSSTPIPQSPPTAPHHHNLHGNVLHHVVLHQVLPHQLPMMTPN